MKEVKRSEFFRFINNFNGDLVGKKNQFYFGEVKVAEMISTKFFINREFDHIDYKD